MAIFPSFFVVQRWQMATGASKASVTYKSRLDMLYHERRRRQMAVEAITEIALSLRSRELNSALPLPSHSIIVAYFLLLLQGRRARDYYCGQVEGALLH